MTQEEVDKVLENVEKIEKVASTNTGNSGIANEDKSCDAILGSFSVTVNNILKFIQYLGPVLVGVFTVIDFIKAALSGEQDDMKKASRNFSKRIIAAILLFFIPTIVNLIFELLGLTAPSACFK
jgi:hypothetical protein